MTRAELDAILDELCIEPSDNLIFMQVLPILKVKHFYEPVAYDGGFVVIQPISDCEAREKTR